MSLFTKKEKVNLEEYCKNYYDDYLFAEELHRLQCELTRDNIIEVDKAFEIKNVKFLISEFLILRLECFALAWYHEFGDKLAIENIAFTKRYLENKDLLDSWEGAMDYNKSISQSATHGCDSSTISGRSRLSFVNTSKVDLFRKYTSRGIDGNYAARVLNKFGTDSKWKNIIVTYEYLVFTLGVRLNYEFNEAARMILISTLKGFYDGSKQAFEKIKVIS